MANKYLRKYDGALAVLDEDSQILGAANNLPDLCREVGGAVLVVWNCWEPLRLDSFTEEDLEAKRWNG